MINALDAREPTRQAARNTEQQPDWKWPAEPCSARNTTKKEHVLRQIKTHLPEIKQSLGCANWPCSVPPRGGTATVKRDIDTLVSFDGPANSQRYFGLQFYLEDLLGTPVDLVTDKVLWPELRPHVEILHR